MFKFYLGRRFKRTMSTGASVLTNLAFWLNLWHWRLTFWVTIKGKRKYRLVCLVLLWSSACINLLLLLIYVSFCQIFCDTLSFFLAEYYFWPVKKCLICIIYNLAVQYRVIFLPLKTLKLLSLVVDNDVRMASLLKSYGYMSILIARKTNL